MTNVMLILIFIIVVILAIVGLLKTEIDQQQELIERQATEIQKYKLFNPKLWEEDQHGGHEEYDHTNGVR